MEERILLAAEADSHAGNIVGLLGPDVAIIGPDDPDDLIELQQTDYQKALWDNRLSDILWAKDFAGEDPLYVAHVGDLTDGRKYPTMKLTTSLSGQTTIAEANISPWFDIAEINGLYIISGTASHVFEDSASEIIVNQLQQAKGRKSDHIHHGLLHAGEARIDVAHHGPSKGIRSWTSGNQLRHYTRSLMIDEALDGRIPPQLILRAHFHAYHKEVVPAGIFTTKIILLPSQCGMGEYGRQATQSSFGISNGMVIFEFIDGYLEQIIPRTTNLDLRTKVYLKN